MNEKLQQKAKEIGEGHLSVQYVVEGGKIIKKITNQQIIESFEQKLESEEERK